MNEYMPRQAANTCRFEALAGVQGSRNTADAGQIYYFVTIHKLVGDILPAMLDKELSYSVAEGAKAGTKILHLDGPLTLANMFLLQADLRGMEPDCLILDLSSVPYMDSAGLGVVMNYYVVAERGGRKFFVTGVNDRIRSLFEMTKVDAVLKISESVEAAQALA